MGSFSFGRVNLWSSVVSVTTLNLFSETRLHWSWIYYVWKIPRNLSALTLSRKKTISVTLKVFGCHKNVSFLFVTAKVLMRIFHVTENIASPFFGLQTSSIDFHVLYDVYIKCKIAFTLFFYRNPKEFCPAFQREILFYSAFLCKS